MAEPGDHRIAERVDPAAIAQEVDAEAAAVAFDRRPERLPRLHHAPEDIVGKRPDAGAGREERRPAPAVHGEFDVPARNAFGWGLRIRPQRLEVRALRRDERQRLVVEHHAHDDAADQTAVLADATAGPEDMALARTERRDLVERLLPAAAAGRFEASGRVLGQVKRERTDDPAFGIVQVDGRRQAVAREVGVRPDDKRAIGGRRF